MTAILILSQKTSPIDQCVSALSSQYTIDISTRTNGIPALKEGKYSLLIVNTQYIDESALTIQQLRTPNLKILLIGEQWPEEKQIDGLVAGASGYCEINVSPVLFIKAAESVLRGEIWIQRHLIPKVIGSLAQLNLSPSNDQSSADKMDIINKLSNREIEVAKLIRTGKSNKRIASTLNISERTVKAHLTSIFKKLKVADRLHLAVSLKGFDI